MAVPRPLTRETLRTLISAGCKISVAVQPYVTRMLILRYFRAGRATGRKRTGEARTAAPQPRSVCRPPDGFSCRWLERAARTHGKRKNQLEHPLQAPLPRFLHGYESRLFEHHEETADGRLNYAGQVKPGAEQTKCAGRCIRGAMMHAEGAIRKVFVTVNSSESTAEVFHRRMVICIAKET
jgi:hypothetical protein